MAYYKTCGVCGSNLDPGEICDCKAAKEREKQARTPDPRQEQAKEKDPNCERQRRSERSRT